MENEGATAEIKDLHLTEKLDRFLMRLGWTAIAILGVLGTTTFGQIVFAARVVYIGILNLIKFFKPDIWTGKGPEKGAGSAEPAASFIGSLPWLYLAFLGWLFIASFFASDKYKAVGAVFGYTLLGLLAIMAARYIARDMRFLKRWVLPLMLITGALIGGWLSYNVFAAGLDRAHLPFSRGANGSGMILAVTSIVVLGYILEQRWWSSALLFVPWFLTVAGIAATLSRGALLGLAAGLFVYLLRWKKILIVLIVVVLLLGFGAKMDQAFRARLDSFFDTDFNSARIKIWTAAAKMIQDHPFFGIGPDNFSLRFPEYKEKMGYPEEMADVYHSHNIFLEVMLAGGLPALAIFVLILFNAFRSAYRISRRGSGLAAALLAVLVTILVHNQVDMVVGSISKLFILAAPCTIAIELDRLDRRERLERFERP